MPRQLASPRACCGERLCAAEIAVQTDDPETLGDLLQHFAPFSHALFEILFHNKQVIDLFFLSPNKKLVDTSPCLGIKDELHVRKFILQVHLDLLDTIEIRCVCVVIGLVDAMRVSSPENSLG